MHLEDHPSQGRYQIIHKLGSESYSTVWLARDEQKNRYVASEIIVVKDPRASSESQILRHLNQYKETQRHPERAYVSSLLDEFFLGGPNGRHLCLVSEPARCSVRESKVASTKWVFQMRIARAIAAQTVLGLAFIHSCGVVHGG